MPNRLPKTIKSWMQPRPGARPKLIEAAREVSGVKDKQTRILELPL